MSFDLLIYNPIVFNVAGMYLFVITERESVGSYLGHPIFKVSSMKILPCDQSLKSSPEEQVTLKDFLFRISFF